MDSIASRKAALVLTKELYPAYRATLLFSLLAPYKFVRGEHGKTVEQLLKPVVNLVYFVCKYWAGVVRSVQFVGRNQTSNDLR